jgi:hypothetical protein
VDEPSSQPEEFLQRETLAPGRNFCLFGQRFKFTVIIVYYICRLLSQYKLNSRYLLLPDFLLFVVAGCVYPED